jgi:hypothetical protein
MLTTEERLAGIGDALESGVARNVAGRPARHRRVQRVVLICAVLVALPVGAAIAGTAGVGPLASVFSSGPVASNVGPDNITLDSYTAESGAPCLRATSATGELLFAGCGDNEGKATSGGTVFAHAGQMVGHGNDNWIMGGALPGQTHAVTVAVDSHPVAATLSNGGRDLVLPEGRNHVGNVTLELNTGASATIPFCLNLEDVSPGVTRAKPC